MNFGNAPRIKEVIQQPPILNWVKCNLDGASNGNPWPSACGGIYRNSNANFLGAFACNLSNSNSLDAELNGAMLAIELAHQKGWSHLWFETDSTLVTLAFKSLKIVPWQLRNRWENCLFICSSMSFFVTRIYREGNHIVLIFWLVLVQLCKLIFGGMIALIRSDQTLLEIGYGFPILDSAKFLRVLVYVLCLLCFSSSFLQYLQGLLLLQVSFS